MAKYIKNPSGHVHSVEDDVYEAMLEGDGDTANRYLPHGYTEVKEAEARKANPQLFGEPDPRVEAARVHLANQPQEPADFEARVQAAVEAKVAEAVAAALAAQQQ